MLRLERVGVEESFFDLGGHSLLATRVVSRVREVLRVELPLRAMFEAPTVAALAVRVEAARGAGAVRHPSVVPVGRDRPLPLSFAQERLWFLDQLESDSAFYNIPAALRLSGALDVRALERALGEVVRRHEALRTTFPEVDGAPVQAIAPFTGFSVSFDDLSALDEPQREAEVRRRAADDAARPFDLAGGPLFRAALLRLSAEEHVLLLSMHHVVSDGWSLGVLFRELSALYAAFVAGEESPLPGLPVQYADFAVWQRERLRGEALDRQLAYWKGRLAGAPALLELPTDHPRPAVQTYRGAQEAVELPAGLLERLETLGRGEGATLYMVLLGAFQLLLSKYAGTDDVVVGSPIAGRTRAEVEGLIGFFVNTLVLRTDLSGDPTVRELLARVRGATLGAYEHQEVPFERLVEVLHPERSLSHAPLFQVMFTLEDAGQARAALPGLRTESVDAELANTKFDLTLALGSDGGRLRGALVYGTDLFDRATIQRMAGHLERVLEQVSSRPDARLSEIELPSAEERGVVLHAWNRTEAAFPADLCIHQLIEDQAERTPDAVAVVFEDDTVTYRGLNARANRLAHRLVRLGVGPEVRVGLCLERSVEMVVSILAVLKAGGAYVPLDPGYPAERLAYMLEDSGVPVLLTQERLRAILPSSDATVLAVDSEWAEIETESAENPTPAVSPSNLAYVIYTSGSTGRPKGAMNAHRGVVNRLWWMQAEYGIGAADVVLQKTPFSFDVSVWEFFWPLQQGARLVMARPEGHRDPAYLAEIIETEGVTTLHFVPSMLQQFVEEADASRCGSLQRVICSGEALPPALVARFHERFPATVGLHNLYGPTEAAVDVSYWACERGDSTGVVPIGRPVWNTQLYVLDAALRPVPVGVPGELYIGGVQVARGYLDRPDLTAERFVPDAFAAEPGARLYRTGDKVRWRTDGALEYLGRLDEQVKIRGLRIELGEIEAAIRRHENVTDCVVVARADAAGEKRLVAYVVGEAEVEALKTALRRSLPEYMVPSAFVFLDALPLSPNGKLDRKALPAPEFVSAAAYVAPRTEVEEALAGIWAEVLRLDRVGVEENFFDLGGHSLLATRVVSRVRADLGVDLPLRAMFEGPTVAALAGVVEAARLAGAARHPSVVPVGRDRPLPLSFAQERLWFLDRLEPGSAFYVLPAALRLSGAMDVRALERALGEIVRRHEALRTVFREAAGGPVQVIVPFGGFALPVHDLSALDEAEREAEVRRRGAEDAARPFDLAAGPLFRAALLRLGAEEHVLLLAMHHVASDGWSLGVLVRELSALYAAYAAGDESPLPELPVQYADYAVWQRERLREEALERPLAYWKARLAGAPALLELPTDHPRPAAQTYRGAREPVSLSLELLDRLHALARREGATLYMVLLGAFQALLARYAGTGDVVVGSPVAGRTRAEVEGLIGFFVNTLVLRADLGGDPTFREVIRRVRETTLGAYEHQELPFERLVAELAPERTLSHAPLAQVMFTLDETGGGPGGVGSLRAQWVAGEVETTKFDLVLSMEADGRGLHGGMEYATDLFERATVRRMLGHLERVLDQVAARPDARLSELEPLSGDERRLVVEEWNRTAAEYPADRCVHELFEEQAAWTPDAVAVVHGDASLTYRALDERANRLAHHLRRHRVGPETRVGVHLERGADLFVAVLGVLKAGGAYVAMDPAYPAGRLEGMMRDSGAAVLLTHSHLPAPPLREGVRVVRLDADAEALAAERATRPASGVTPRGLAYVVYTSGSTGTPKGVAVEHAALASLCAWHAHAFAVTAADRATQLASPGFDASVWEVWPYLTRGASIEVVPDEVRSDPPALRDWLASRGATISFVPTPVAEPMLALEWPRETALRWLLTGGDRLRARPAAALPFGLSNNYGPTECTVVATSGLVASEGDRAPSIGGPIENTRVYVLDGAMRPLPPGVPGELFIGGAQVARGYLGRPELTADRFLPDPFSVEPGARLYRTGDKVRWLPDGTLEYLGRLDEQVKVRGFRIELGEIEAVLRRHPDVADCAVIAREDGGEKRLAAYVAGPRDAEALKAHLRGTLPDYMVPAAFVFLDALPLTANGKLDRRALPAPEYASSDAYVAPRTEVEGALAEVWAEVLGLARVGVEESFFDLGGHSLLATRVVSRVREALGVEIPLRAMFEGPTVARLAARVEASRADAESPETSPAVVSLAPVARAGALPLSFAQERLWFLDQLERDSAFYNIPAALRLSGALDVGALERALGEVVRRHEALRTVFPEVDGAPVQAVAPFGGFALAVDDLSALGRAGREAEVRRRVAEDAARPFDLAHGPLFRAALLRLGADEHVLLLSMHHIVSDGWSFGVLFRELSALYEAYADGRESPLADLPVQYADFAVWQRAQLRGEVLERQLAYWKGRLAGAPALLELPTDHPRPAVQTYRGAQEAVDLPAGLLGRLEALGWGEGATLYMVLLGAFQLLLSKYAGTDDVVVGSPMAGRTRGEVEGLIGFFVNTLVLRTDLSGDPTFRELLGRVRDTTLDAYEHQEVPFERLVAELAPERSLSHAPLFQVMFTLEDVDGTRAALPGLRTEAVEAEVTTTKFDLTLSLGSDGGRLRGSIGYSTDLFDRATIQRMAGHLARVLEQVADDAGRRVSEVELLTGAERELVVHEWNRTEAAYPAGRCIHQLFEAQAARTPDAVAVVHEETSLTYAELNARANRLARHLRRHGVGPEVRVGVCLERGADLVVALMGVLKAGGAYVPLDPAYPTERLERTLADASVGALVTQEKLRGLVATAPGVHVVVAERDAEAIAAESAEDFDSG
ncbi:MAG TPA: amino acid adenylation domain-containing protein, partial [Longimicrobium sp.]|nr:amino acid adenylation domain-containing protein [Longimicrobium sp.]